MHTSIPDLLASYEENFDPNKAAGLDGTVQLSLSGDDGGEYAITIRDQALAVEEGVHEDPDVLVKTTADHWLAVNNGKANPMMLMMQGKLKIKGSMAMATKFQALFS